MMRASVFRLTPFLLLAAMLMAASILLVHDARPAAADHGEEETIWSATLTVKAFGHSGIQRGCHNAQSGAKCSTTSNLTDDDFTYGGASYEVREVAWVHGNSAFALGFDGHIPAGLKDVTVLYVDGTAFPLASVTSERTSNPPIETLNIRGSIDWSAGDTVTLELKRPAAPPSGVELAGTDLDTSGGAGHYDIAVTEGASATFTVALSADPGTDATVTLLKTQYNQPGVGADDHRWNVNAATVAPETLTFTAGGSGNWNTPQTVTVTGADDADSCSEQLIILVLSPNRSEYDYVYVGEGNGGYDLNANGQYVWVGTGEGEYNYQQVDGYEPAGGTSSSVTGVSVTVTDDDGGSCGGV